MHRFVVGVLLLFNVSIFGHFMSFSAMFSVLFVSHSILCNALLC